MQKLIGYIVLFEKDNAIWVLHNEVYPSKAVAESKATEEKLKNYVLNGVNIWLPALSILCPPGE